MGGKRKSRGGGEGPANSRKRKTAAATIPTRQEEIPPNSGIDEPLVEDIIKVELEPDVFPVLNDDHQEFFDNLSNQYLDPADPDIDIGDMILMRIPKVEPMAEYEYHDHMDSNTISETATPNIGIEANNVGKSHASPSTSKPPEGLMSPTECENFTGSPWVTTRDENNESTSNCSADSTGNPLLNKMAEKCEGIAGVEGENVDEDTTSTTMSSHLLSEGTTAVEEAQEMSPGSGSVNKNASKKILTGVSETNAENKSKLKKTVGDIITRLTTELKGATDHNELLQRKVDSENSRNNELSRQIKQSGEEAQNYAAQCEGLKKELKKAIDETEILTRKLHTKSADLERQISQSRLLEEEHKKLALENSRTMQGELNGKDEVIRKQTKEIEGLQKVLKTLGDGSKESNRKIDLLNDSMSKKDNELARFKAWYLGEDQGNSQLHLAAKEGDEQSVKELITWGADVNARNENSETPILLAASSDGDAKATLQIVKDLIEHGADVFATDGEGQTFLHKIVSNGNPPSSSQFQDIWDYLVSRKLTGLFNIQDKGHGRTPLMMAARNVDLDMVTISLLQTNGVDFNLADKSGRSHLSYAAEGNKNMNLLVEYIGDGSTKHRNLVLGQAIKDEDEAWLKLLVSLGADVNETNDVFETPLHLAAGSQNEEFAVNAIEHLINCGANVDAKNEYGKIFLYEFVVCNANAENHPAQFYKLASFLDLKGLSRLFSLFNTVSNLVNYHCPLMPFYWAVYMIEMETETLSLLKERGVDFNAVDKKGCSVLGYATFGSRTLEMISALVALGANPKHLTTKGKGMLHIAAENGRVDVLKFFLDLDQGLDVNARNAVGETPLHCTFLLRTNIIETVQFLLKNGADPDIVNHNGKSPRDFSNERRAGYPDVGRLFPPASRLDHRVEHSS